MSVLLGCDRQPRSLRAQVHYACLLEPNRPGNRLTDNAGVSQVALHRLREVVQHLFGDDALSTGVNLGEQFLDILMRETIEGLQTIQHGNSTC